MQLLAPFPGASKLLWIRGYRGSLKPPSPAVTCFVCCSGKRLGWAKEARVHWQAQASCCPSQGLSFPILTMNTSKLLPALILQDPAILLSPRHPPAPNTHSPPQADI